VSAGQLAGAFEAWPDLGPDWEWYRELREIDRGYNERTVTAMSGVTDRAGPAWERKVADYAHDDYGLPWDRAPLRGARDRLDISGCIDDGWLVGCKAIHRGVNFGQRISEAMTQCDQALVNIGRPAEHDRRGFLVVDSGRVVPIQVMQRSGYPVGKAYVVTQLDYILRLAVARRALEAELAAQGGPLAEIEARRARRANG
jgi:hypothetical protein